ncbi:IGEB protein, partial [Zapornia atra]|nr:IGEB protein [Zapornia atra]
VMGLPRQIKTDNGPAYSSHGFKMFCRQWGADHVTGIARSLTAQAIVEWAHQT